MTLLNTDVTKLIESLNHPLINELAELREIILSSNIKLTENIKWNSPNFSIDGNDLFTIKIYPLTKVQIIFHRGAKKQQPIENKLINDPHNLLTWRENDRAIYTLNSKNSIGAHKLKIQQLINDWIKSCEFI